MPAIFAIRKKVGRRLQIINFLDSEISCKMLICKLKNSTMKYTSDINKSGTLRTNKLIFINKFKVDIRQTQGKQTQNLYTAVLFQSGCLISIITVTIWLIVVNIW